MKKNLDAVEDLLGTLAAGRTRLRMLAHRHLSFSNALLADGVQVTQLEHARCDVSLVQDLVRQHVRTVMPPQRVESTTTDLDDPPTQVVRNLKNRSD